MHCAHAIAFEAAAALDQYESDLAFLRDGDAQACDFARADAEVRAACSRCMRLPQLCVDAIALLLSHHRLLAELGRPGEARARHAPLARLQSHQRCIARLRRQCRKLFIAPHLQ
ncbi:hypothetical protein [Ramlibacter sp. AN1133]|uniref:hypothetical protein n=1 Tax=Ramlibacter sp. AN1133 TaxID=3133429 RepID=UPI0030BBB6E2